MLVLLLLWTRLTIPGEVPVETATLDDIAVELSVNAGDVVFDTVIDSFVTALEVTSTFIVVLVPISIR